MRAEPRSWDDKIAVVTTEDGALWISCEITDPPSMARRAVDVYVAPEQVASLLAAARTAGIKARSKPMSDS